MKQCISRMKVFFIHLWQTLKKYVCRRNTRESLVNGCSLKKVITDGDKETTIEFTLNIAQDQIDYNIEDSDQIIKDKEELNYEQNKIED